VVAGCWILPAWNHPFNDDWSYGFIAKTFLETGKIEFINWGEPILVSHLAWGALFARLFGFSFTSLQLSVLVLSAAGGIFFYLILKLLNIPRFLSLAGAALLVVNPVYFTNSFSYMTDSVFVSETLMALYFYLASSGKKRAGFSLLSGFFSVLAFSNRQFALVLPVAMGIHLLVSGTTWKQKRILFLCAGILPVLADAFIFFWHRSLPNVPIRSLGIQPAVFYCRAVFLMILYAGFFSMPVVLPWMLSPTHRSRLNARVKPVFQLGALAAGVAALCLMPVKTMPLLGNNITRFGMFESDELLPGGRFDLFPRPFWIAATALTLISTAFLVFMIAEAVRSRIQPLRVKRPGSVLKALFSTPASVVGLASFFLFLCPLVIGSLFDRYTVMFLPGVFLAALKAYSDHPRGQALIASGLLLFSVFTIILVFDTVGWNRIRWREAERLVREGVSPMHIDAGVEWCGWYAKKPFPAGYRRAPKPYYVSWYLRDCFDSIDNRYAVSFSGLNGFSVLRTVRYRTVFWKTDPFLYVLKRNASD